MIGGLVNISVFKGEIKFILYVFDYVKYYIISLDNVENILKIDNIFKFKFDNYVIKDYKLVEDKKY